MTPPPPPQRATTLLLAVLACASAGCFDFGALKPKARDAGDDAAGSVDACAGGACARSFVPSYIGDAGRLTSGTVRITIAEGETATWNVDTGVLDHGGADGGVDTETITPETIAQADGAPAISVFSVKSFTIEDNAALTLVGTNAVAILSAEDIVINGLLDVSGTGTIGGPGGESATADAQPAAAHSGRRGAGASSANGLAYAAPGGGGGSNATAGGTSGSAMATQTFPTPNTATVARTEAGALLGTEIFRGGGAGGGVPPHGTIESDANGGGGGGALLLASAAAIRVGDQGKIDAGGAGGGPPAGGAGVIAAGPGGGAGGTLLLEAPVVTVEGGVFANGGGGCGADYRADASPTPGEDGRRDASAAAGSLPVGVFNGVATSRGGDGAAGGAPAAARGADVAASAGSGVVYALSGGGGGGAGRIAILTLTGEIEGAGEFSPKSPATYDVAKLVPLD